MTRSRRDPSVSNKSAEQIVSAFVCEDMCVYVCEDMCLSEVWSLQSVFACVALIDVHVRWSLTELSEPLASWWSLMAGVILSNVPAITAGAVAFYFGDEKQRLSQLPVLLWIAAGVLGCYMLHLTDFCCRCVWHRSSLYLPSLLRTFRDGKAREGMLPEQPRLPLFSLVSRLRPYAMILLKATSLNFLNFTGASLDKVPSASSTFDSRRGGNIRSEEFTNSVGSANRDLSELDYDEEMTADGFVDDDVSLARYICICMYMCVCLFDLTHSYSQLLGVGRSGKRSIRGRVR